MAHRLLLLLTNLAIDVLALLLVDEMFTGITLESWQTVLAAAVALAIVNAYVRPLVVVLTLPINILTLGLFTLVINALMLQLVGWLIPGFRIASFWTALGAALVLSLVSLALNSLIKPKHVHIHIQRP